MVAELSRPVDQLAIASASAEIALLSPVDCRNVVSRFTPGLYSRQILLQAGCRYLSRVHRTEHQFIVSQGVCWVIENGTRYQIVAPFHGITKPGTWRDIFALMDCVWTTFHATDKTTAEEVEREITEPTEEKQ